jgi:phosphoglycolate phosphatase-like HAD superfamily hydrolase
MNIMNKRAEQFHLYDTFDFIVPEAKDKGRAIRTLLHDYMDAPPKQAVFIDDCDDALASAKRAGVATIGVLFGHQPDERIMSAQPDFVAQNFDDIAGILLARRRISA